MGIFYVNNLKFLHARNYSKALKMSQMVCKDCCDLRELQGAPPWHKVFCFPERNHRSVDSILVFALFFDCLKKASVFWLSFGAATLTQKYCVRTRRAKARIAAGTEKSLGGEGSAPKFLTYVSASIAETSKRRRGRSRSQLVWTRAAWRTRAEKGVEIQNTAQNIHKNEKKFVIRGNF